MQRQDIHPRNLKFGTGGVEGRWWHSGSAEKTILFDALSIMFPHGEKFFMDSVRYFERDITDTQLRTDIKGFLHQEAIHTREHLEYNARLERLGYPADKLDAGVKARFDFVRRHFGKQRQLGITLALEHFTAILAHEMLTVDAHLDGAEPAFKRLWQWHSLEEAEHRSVAFNVFQKRFGSSIGTYFLRCRIMLITTVIFNMFIWSHVRQMMRVDGLSRSPKAWARMLWFAFGSSGIFRRIALPWATYFLPGFHPQNHGGVPDAHRIEKALLAGQAA
jgi:uncharacterized protein